LLRNYRHSGWFVVETTNFQVCSDESEVRVKSLAKHAESLRAELRTKWLRENQIGTWNPKCQIVLHKTKNCYVAAVGKGSEQTVGSSLVKAQSGNTICRRIDLLGGETDFLRAALPHELTHVVLQERFTCQSIPRWADEGVAVLADPPSKQLRHDRDLRNAVANGDTFQTIALLTLEEYPGTDRFGVFYGQSKSLAEFLIARKSTQDFADFLEKVDRIGYDAALRHSYQIANVRELDRLWRDSLFVNPTLAANSR
jgi:hypothetical protein